MSALRATWYDGRSARGRDAWLDQPAPGRLRVRAGDEVREFEAASLRLSPRLGALPRQLALPGEGHLELEHSPLLEQWLPRRGQVEAFADWLERRRLAVLGSAAALVLGVVGFFELGLPWMANEVAPMVPPAMERAITKQAMALLDGGQFQPSRLPEARREALKLRFHEITRGLPRADGLRLEFRDARLLGPNALALPDGLVVMTDQLVELTDDEDELLAVLAHEAGHHEHRHGMRRALESSAVVVVAGFLFGDLSGTGSLSVSIPTLLVNSGFSRRHEREADAFAFALLPKHGISPEAFARVMTRLSDGDGETAAGPIGYLSTHPPSAERIEAARRAARDPKENGR